MADDIGIQHPVVRRLIDPSHCRIVDFDAVEDVDERLADGDITDVEDDEGTQDTLLQHVHPCLAPSDLDHQPENDKDKDTHKWLQCIHKCAGDGTLHGASCWDETIHRSIHCLGCDSTDKLCRQGSQVILGERDESLFSPAVWKSATNANVHFASTAMAMAVTCTKFTVICRHAERLGQDR